jgi:two-component system sensor histidine kinase DesK
MPEGTDHGRSVHNTWLYTLGSIVFFFLFFDFILLLMMAERFTVSQDPLEAAVVIVTLLAVAMQVRYCWFLRVGREGGLPHAAWTVALVAPAAVTWVLGLVAPGASLLCAVPLWMAACLVACLLPKPQRWALLAAGVVITVGHPVLATQLSGRPLDLAGSSGGFMIAIYSATLPFMVLTSLWWWEIVVRLDRHRRIAAELAVTQERLRFASDLHDIQGHHLQVISLKSELAERLLAIDPEAAREHLHETRLIAKRALEETRSLVAGYREIALDDELENAREVLAAAGARCELRLDSLPSDAAVRSALAAVVREATTNILRHSTATDVRIALSTSAGTSTLEIGNDGVSDTADVAGRATSTGLAGLRDRLAALGGRLEATTDAASGRFRLRATVPVVAGATA